MPNLKDPEQRRKHYARNRRPAEKKRRAALTRERRRRGVAGKGGDDMCHVIKNGHASNGRGKIKPCSRSKNRAHGAKVTNRKRRSKK